jgi:Asp-tRNA(Asn)/Glu-tRNA(Gln) amidotransferase A subunit family amidase
MTVGTGLWPGDAVREGRLRATELAASATGAARRDRLGCFWALDEERTLRDAARIDELVARGGDPGPLAGFAVVVKDCFDVEALPTTGGVAAERRRIAQADAAIVAALRRAGALVLGKAAMHQLAWGMTGQAPRFATCRNPLDPTRMPGGSSSGCAAAVAASVAAIAIGTDAGGSVRAPAAWCGVVGFKPTLGSVALDGCLPMTPSLDTGGIFARSVDDVRRVFAVVARSAGRGARSKRRLRVGVAESFFDGDEVVATACRRALDAWAGAGAVVTPMTLEWPRRLLGPIYAAEFASEWGAAVDGEPELYGEDVRAGVTVGRAVAAVEYVRARRAVESLRPELEGALGKLDVVATPTVPILPPHLAEPDPVAIAGRNTRPFNGLGWPAASIPCGSANGLSIGLQLAGRPGRDLELLAAAAELEAVLASSAAR